MFDIITCPELKTETFRKFQKYIYDIAGIRVADSKTEFFKGRVYKRLRALSLRTFEQYFDYVSNPIHTEEVTSFLNVISTNVTHFFRENQHFDVMTNILLPKLSKQKKITIWSAGCSNGSEPYTMAIVVNEFLEKAHLPSPPQIEIVGCDLSMDMLKVALRGVYDEDLLRETPDHIIRKYFRKGVRTMAGKYQVNDFLKSSVKFYQHNLLEPFDIGVSFDIVFCRNVMIYFDSNIKSIVVNNIFDFLKKGGHFFIGHSESIVSLSKKSIASSVYVNE